MKHPLSMSEAVRLHGQHLRAKRRSAATLRWYAEQFAAFDQWRLRFQLPDELPDADSIDAFLASQHDAGLKPSTVNGRFRALRALYLFLERRRRIKHDDNPVHLVDAPTVPREARRYVSQETYSRLINSIAGQSWLAWRDRLILNVLYYSGLRVGELCGLCIDDVNQQALEITVRRGKGDKARIVPAHPELPKLFVAYLLSRPCHTPELLLASDGYDGCTGQLTREGVRQMLIRRCRAAGVDYYNPHSFRHGFAMWTLNAGVRMSTVSTLMGHSDQDITQRVYAHTLPSTARNEYDAALKSLNG
jgi:integrase